MKGFLPIEIRAMRDSVEDCLRYARDTEDAFKQVRKEVADMGQIVIPKWRFLPLMRVSL